MPLLDRSYLANVKEADLTDALVSWEWLVGRDMTPLFLTLSGDVFLRNEAGRTFWLDTGSGESQQVAESELEFDRAWADDARRGEWLLKDVVENLIASGNSPGAGQCFGYKVLPILGGDFDGENRVAVSAQEHVSVTGYLHSQLADLPDGSSIEVKVVD